MRYRSSSMFRLNGDSFGTTEDQLEADSAEQAEQQAIRAWRAVRPDRTFHPLLTFRVGPDNGGMAWQ